MPPKWSKKIRNVSQCFGLTHAGGGNEYYKKWDSYQLIYLAQYEIFQ